MKSHHLNSLTGLAHSSPSQITVARLSLLLKEAENGQVLNEVVLFLLRAAVSVNVCVVDVIERGNSTHIPYMFKPLNILRNFTVQLESSTRQADLTQSKLKSSYRESPLDLVSGLQSPSPIRSPIKSHYVYTILGGWISMLDFDQKRQRQLYTTDHHIVT